MKSPVSELVKTSLTKTNAHGLARLVGEKQVYIRVLWLIVWLACCALFLRQLVGFAKRLAARDVTTTFQADAIPFEYPDLYICHDNPMSGSMHLQISRKSAAYINASFERSVQSILELCEDIDCEELRGKVDAADQAAVQLNSLPYQLLVNEMAHTTQQTILIASMIRSNGLTFKHWTLDVDEFYHPSHLRCHRVSVNETLRQEIKFVGSDDLILLKLMMDAPDSRMGHSNLPVVRTEWYNLTAPFWALDNLSLNSRVRDATLRIYITKPGHYPSRFDDNVQLEAGRSYTLQLEMREQERRDDPSKCVDKHPSVSIVNPFDNSAYSVPYDYAYCYSSAVQAQFQRETNASCGFLPRPWPPRDDRLLYNLSSGWGSAEDVRKFINGRRRLRPEEPLERCADRYLCRERTYSTTLESTLWPSVDAIESELGELVADQEDVQFAPGLRYLSELASKGNITQQIVDYIRANFLFVELSAKRSRADLIIITQAYSFESFVADVGGILGIYLGMSLLTACEVAQFCHDLLLLLLRTGKTGHGSEIEPESAGSREEPPAGWTNVDVIDVRAIKKM